MLVLSTPDCHRDALLQMKSVFSLLSSSSLSSTQKPAVLYPPGISDPLILSASHDPLPPRYSSHSSPYLAWIPRTGIKMRYILLTALPPAAFMVLAGQNTDPIKSTCLLFTCMLPLNMAENNTETLTGLTLSSWSSGGPKESSYTSLAIFHSSSLLHSVLYLLSSKTLSTFSPVLSDDDLASCFSERIEAARETFPQTSIILPTHTCQMSSLPSLCRWQFCALIPD